MRIFPSLRMRPEGISHNSLVLLESKNMIDWLVGMLPVSKSGLVEENALEVFHYYCVHFSSNFLI
jgi:hypothetical protein